jgi:hypothetical protein
MSGTALAVVLHPAAAITPAIDFEPYLQALTITAYEVDFDNPTLLPVPPHILIGELQHRQRPGTSEPRAWGMEVAP